MAEHPYGWAESCPFTGGGGAGYRCASRSYSLFAGLAAGALILTHGNPATAFIVIGIAALLGTVLVGYGVSVWILLPLQTAALFGLLMFVGGRVEVNGAEPSSE